MSLTAAQIDRDIRAEFYNWGDAELDALLTKPECQRLRNELVTEYEGEEDLDEYHVELSIATEAIAQRREEV